MGGIATLTAEDRPLRQSAAGDRLVIAKHGSVAQRMEGVATHTAEDRQLRQSAAEDRQLRQRGRFFSPRQTFVRVLVSLHACVLSSSLRLRS